jgi:hypothetical protein
VSIWNSFFRATSPLDRAGPISWCICTTRSKTTRYAQPRARFPDATPAVRSQDLYLIMDFMKGGDLRYYLGACASATACAHCCSVLVLDKHGNMSEHTCRSVAAVNCNSVLTFRDAQCLRCGAFVGHGGHEQPELGVSRFEARKRSAGRIWCFRVSCFACSSAQPEPCFPSVAQATCEYQILVLCTI